MPDCRLALRVAADQPGDLRNARLPLQRTDHGKRSAARFLLFNIEFFLRKCRDLRQVGYRNDLHVLCDLTEFFTDDARRLAANPRINLIENICADGIDGRSVAVAFNNSLTFLMSELTGRSYGGGVLTFEPSEARSLPIPFNDGISFDFERADELVRSGKTDELISYVDAVILREHLGMTSQEIALVRDGWLMLRNRRLARKKR